MTIRDLFRIIIKLFCVYGFVQVSFYYLPVHAIGLVYGGDVYWTVLTFIFLLLISFGIFKILTNKVDAIIDWLKLDKGYDQQLIQVGNFNETKLASVAIILIGGLLIVDYLPDFLYHFYTSLKKEVNTSGLERLFDDQPRTNYFGWGISAMNLVLGYLLIANHRFLAKKLAQKITVDEYIDEEE